MNAQELRIGNWVQIEGVPKKVIAVYSAHIRYSGIGKGIHPIAHVEPIPLTPEILEMAGFKKTNPRGAAYFKICGIDSAVMTINCVDGIFSFSSFPVEIYTVHHFMNLYHSLTGTELNIQL